MIEGLDIVPSNLDLMGAELELSNQLAREFILKNKLAYVFSPPQLVQINLKPISTIQFK
jgi:chromosome partitioning protein